jgi:hypothetical protein
MKFLIITSNVFATGGPKNYAYKLLKPDKEGNLTCCKIRGITLNNKNSLELNFETVKDMVRGEKKSVTITDEHKIRRNLKTADIITCVEEKDYKIVFDKRVLMDDFFRNACTKSGSLRFSQFSGC